MILNAYSRMKRINPTALLAIAVVLFIVLRVYGTTCSSEGFADTDKQIIIVKAEWCGHCQKAAPEFAKIEKNGKIPVKILDADKNKDEVNALNVKGYPTILFMENGNKTEYSGQRTCSAVMTAAGLPDSVC
jgi:thiol-disulfide isomerase/thioredoxin